MTKFIRSIFHFFGYDIIVRGAVVVTTRQIGTISYLAEMYRRIESVPGAIVECGVGKGRTFLYLTALAASDQKARQVWGFDSFEGFPEPTKEDESGRQPKKGEWAGVSPSYIMNMLRIAGVGTKALQNVRLVKGFVESTLSSYDGQSIALLHVDLDLYSAYAHTLDMLVQYVSPGGLVIFDEYGEDKWPGATKAVDEFLKDKEWKLERHQGSGKYFFQKI